MAFGFLIPLAQIPLAVITCIILRANVLAAAATTFISNPITFAPIYYFAFKLGNGVVGVNLESESELLDSKLSLEWLALIGLPLYLGLALCAVISSVTVYIFIHVAWKWIERFIKGRGPIGN